MEMYENEHDQVDAIKRFFAENGKALVVCAGGLALLEQPSGGFRARVLENTVSAIRADQPQTLAAAEKFAADNYGALAALEVAQRYVDKTNWIKPLLSCLRALLLPAMKT